MRRFAVQLVLVTILAAPAGASADIRFRGTSGQDRAVALRTDDAGMITRVRINWRAPCRRPGFFFTTFTRFFQPFQSLTRDRMVDAGRNRLRLRDGLRAVFRIRIAANRVSETRWRGIFRVSTSVLRGGRLVDRCYKRTRWRVRRAG
ncbi:MAG: hypothetical protein QOE69_594 [Thermoleophilaceae bacterium]|jgi:hypothetical protein|nr:hypothetical protein [Thermoleophilaceae bacterium]